MAPYILWGHIKINGLAQDNETVTVRNDTKGEQYNYTTKSGGVYAANLGYSTHFPSGFSVGDTIKVTWNGKTVATTVQSGEGGEEININELTLADAGAGAETVTRPEKRLYMEDGAAGVDAAKMPERFFSLSEQAIGAETMKRDKPTMAPILDSALGIEIPFKTRTVGTISDLASGIESIEASKQFGIQDTAVGAETVLRPERTITLTDLAAGAEIVGKTIIGQILKEIFDAAVGVDTPTRPEKTMALADFAVGAENLLKTRFLAAIIDAAAGGESFGKELTLSDVAAGLEAILKTRYLQVPDAAVGAEVFGKEMDLFDVGAGIDAVFRKGTFSIVLETATGLDLVIVIKPGAEEIMIPSFRVAANAFSFDVKANDIVMRVVN